VIEGRFDFSYVHFGIGTSIILTLRSPFILKGMDVVDQLYAGYGEGAPAGQGPNQGLIQAKGNSYLKDKFPNLSYILSAK
jgi:peptidyl-prolyl cis-trans isomerase A (cyclophilin A)